MKKTRLPATMAAAIALLALAPAQAATEAWALYDAFGNGKIDKSLWFEGERARSSNGSGTMRLAARGWTLAPEDGGTSTYSDTTMMADPSRVTQLSAAFKVTSVEAETCAGNGNTSVARARLIGTFFNTGTPRVGSFYGDVMAQIVLFRASNSSDGPGVLRVSGILSVCTDTDCIGTSPLGSVDLGTANVNAWIFLQLEHDRANKRFVFGRDQGATVQTVSYTVNDTAGVGRPFKGIGTRLTTATCPGSQPEAKMDAQVTKIRVNKSAL